MWCSLNYLHKYNTISLLHSLAKKIADNVHHEALIVANFVVIIQGIAFKLEKLTQLFQV